jgi:predicted ATP-grasp superfamily ATP-dependent carboligase
MKMLPLKANIAPNTGGLEYKVVGEEVFINGQYSSEGKIQWGEKTCASVDAAIKMKSKDDKPVPFQLAMTWLTEHLKDGELHAAAEVLTSAEYAGFTEVTLKTASEKLGTIQKTRPVNPGPWFWSIPKTHTEATQTESE